MQKRAEKLIEMIEKKCAQNNDVDWVTLASRYRELLRLAVDSPKYFDGYVDDLLTGQAK